MDGDQAAIVTVLFLFLGGSFLAALAAIDQSLLPVAVVGYLFVAVLLIVRIRRADSIWKE